MWIDNHAIGILESMAKLNLVGEEKEKAIRRMKELEDSFKVFENIDTEGVEPLIMVVKTVNVLRDDIPEKNISREEILANAPDQNRGYFQVPGTLD